MKELREKSGAGMMDCKKALQETGGDMEAAIDWLRAKGLSKAAKKADRVAAEGLVAVASRDDGTGMTGAVDRAERRDRLRGPQRHLPGRGAEHRQGRPGRRAATSRPSRRQDRRRARPSGTPDHHLIATIGENMLLRRAARFSVSPGAIAAYVHKPWPAP